MATKQKKNVNKRTYVAIVVDRSGSMNSIRKETVDGINEQLQAIKKNAEKGGNTEVSLIQFDDHIENVFVDKKPSELKEWAYEEFVPRGWTAMYDGIWSAINHLKTKKETKDTGFLVCVISDGRENASKEVDHFTLSEEIKKLQDSGKWTFSYLLANSDIRDVGAKLSVPVSNIVAYTSTGVGTSAALACNAASTVSYFSGRSAGATSTSNFYTTDQQDLLAKTK